MFYWREEGQGFPKSGIYMYRPSDPSSAGIFFVLKHWCFRIRYSKRCKRLHVSFAKREPVVFEFPEHVVEPRLNTDHGDYYYGHEDKWHRLGKENYVKFHYWRDK